MADSSTIAQPLVDSSTNGESGRDVEEQQTSDFVDVSYGAIARNFIVMGWTAFGGPQAHIGLFETTFVQRLKWMSESVFMELYALSACLPGPTSTQVSFALGAIKRGLPGGLLGGVLFQYPGLVIMSLAGVGAVHLLTEMPAWYIKAVVDGLAAVGVALVAVAAKGLVAKAVKDQLTACILVASAVTALVATTSWLFPALILGGGAITLAVNSAKHANLALAPIDEGGVRSFGVSRRAGAALLLLWAALLGGAALGRWATDYADHWVEPLHWFESFYRIGSLIYGGGQVVLPMLIQETVQQDCYVDDSGRRHCHEDPESWVSLEQFKAGLALIQAMPGPMFNFSAYLGAVIALRAGWSPVIGVAACWLGLFGPGILLLYGLLPFWGAFRASNVYRRSLPGLNAAAVGLVVTAVFSMYDSFTASSLFPHATVAIGVIAFALVDTLKFPAPVVILCGGLLGLAAGALKMA